eukprot:5816149-Prymnesium_polylepis.1
MTQQACRPCLFFRHFLHLGLDVLHSRPDSSLEKDNTTKQERQRAQQGKGGKSARGVGAFFKAMTASLVAVAPSSFLASS